MNNTQELKGNKIIRDNLVAIVNQPKLMDHVMRLLFEEITECCCRKTNRLHNFLFLSRSIEIWLIIDDISEIICDFDKISFTREKRRFCATQKCVFPFNLICGLIYNRIERVSKPGECLVQ